MRRAQALRLSGVQATVAVAYQGERGSNSAGIHLHVVPRRVEVVPDGIGNSFSRHPSVFDMCQNALSSLGTTGSYPRGR